MHLHFQVPDERRSIFIGVCLTVSNYIFYVDLYKSTVEHHGPLLVNCTV